MGLYLGSSKRKISINGLLLKATSSSSIPIVNGILLKTLDNYILKDSNGLFLTTKDGD